MVNAFDEGLPKANSESKIGAGKVCGLFAGIGGLEAGLGAVGYEATLLCEKDPDAVAVLRHRFPDVEVHPDIQELDALPSCEVVTAGFPCQDLSMAGSKVGIGGERSGLVTRLFDLLGAASAQPRWLVIENVPYMLSLSRGEAMAFLTSELERLGFRWAYRVVDARAFDVPQRRLRVVLVASRTEDPTAVLFGSTREPTSNDSTDVDDPSRAYGFYWTEGKRGLGWTVDAVPTIKGGSTIGIPSPPAIWHRPLGEKIGLPDIRDLERMQGFAPDWTASARSRQRWRLVGNAVCVRVAEWLGSCLTAPPGLRLPTKPSKRLRRWPKAAYGGPGIQTMEVEASAWPTAPEVRTPLHDFLKHPLRPLSPRATRGYLSRTAQATSLNFPPGFIDALRVHLEQSETPVESSPAAIAVDEGRASCSL